MGVHVTPVVEMGEEQREELRRLQGREDQIRQSVGDSQREIDRFWWASVRRNFVLTHEHVALLRRMRFQLVEDTDLVSVGADGKRPFGNGDWVADVFKILDWEPRYDSEGITRESCELAAHIVAELPLALMEILRRFDMEAV